MKFSFRFRHVKRIWLKIHFELNEPFHSLVFCVSSWILKSRWKGLIQGAMAILFNFVSALLVEIRISWDQSHQIQMHSYRGDHTGMRTGDHMVLGTGGQNPHALSLLSGRQVSAWKGELKSESHIRWCQKGSFTYFNRVPVFRHKQTPSLRTESQMSSYSRPHLSLPKSWKTYILKTTAQ